MMNRLYVGIYAVLLLEGVGGGVFGSSVEIDVHARDRGVEVTVTRGKPLTAVRDQTYDIEICKPVTLGCEPGDEVIFFNVTLDGFNSYYIGSVPDGPLLNHFAYHVRARINGEASWSDKKEALPLDIKGPLWGDIEITPTDYSGNADPEANAPVVSTVGRPVYGYLDSSVDEGKEETDIIYLNFDPVDDEDLVCFLESSDIRGLGLHVFNDEGKMITSPDGTPGNHDDPDDFTSSFLQVQGISFVGNSGFPGDGIDDGYVQFFDASGEYYFLIRVSSDRQAEGEYRLICKEVPDPEPPTQRHGTYEGLSADSAVEVGPFNSFDEVVVKEVLLTACSEGVKCSRSSESAYFYFDVPPKNSARDPNHVFVVSAISNAMDIGIRILPGGGGSPVASNHDSLLGSVGGNPVVPLTTLQAGTYYIEVVEGNSYRSYVPEGPFGPRFGPVRLYVKIQPDLPGSVPERAVEIPLPDPREGYIPAEAILAGDIDESDGTTDADYFRIDVEDVVYPDRFLGEIELDGTWLQVEAVTREKVSPGDILPEVSLELLDENLAAVPGMYVRYLYPVPRTRVSREVLRLRQVNSANLTGLVKKGRYYLRVTRRAGEDAFPYAVALNQVPEQQRYHDFCPEQPGGKKYSDPLYGCEWHLNSARTRREPAVGQAYTAINMNVESVWASGYDGEGIVVAVVDSGVDDLHPDLEFRRDLNHHFGNPKDLPDEDRRNIFVPTATHGTRTAGVVSATANDIGTRGVAPKSSIFGVTLLGNPRSVVDAHEADAMALHMEHAAVSNNSWGPRGNYVKRTRAWELAIEEGINAPWANSNHRGYRGRGVSYLFAGGNAHFSDGNTNLEELNNFYGTMMICAVGSDGYRSSFSELGASLWVCGPSGSGSERPRDESGRSLFGGLPTTAAYGSYSLSFSGTSAATPAVSGVVALMRQANPELTWRDVKLILAETARKMEPSPEGYIDPNELGFYRERLSAWRTGARKYRGSGSYQFSYEYGFGLVDAAAAVNMAKGWPLLPAFTRAIYSGKAPYDEDEVADSSTTVTVPVEADNDVLDFIEYVEIEVSMFSKASRDLDIRLVHVVGEKEVEKEVSVSELTWSAVSPSETRFGSADLHGQYRLGTSMHLGEDPKGKWLVEFKARRAARGRESAISGVKLTFYGHKKGTAPSPVPPLPDDPDPDPDDPDPDPDDPDPDPDDPDPDDDDGDPGDGRTGTGACTYETPYWRDGSGFSDGGGFVVRPTNGRSAEFELICGSGVISLEETLFARDDGLIVQHVEKLRCGSGGVARFRGIQPGGWYFKHGDQNAAAAPLVCSDLPSGRSAVRAEGLKYDAGEAGTLVQDPVSGLIGIVPHIASSSCPSPDGDFDEYVTPYWQGHGGLVVEASGPAVVVNVKCEEDEETLYFPPGEDGIVAAHLRLSFCMDRHKNPRLGTVRVQGAKPGGWYWVNGDSSVAVAPLVCEDQLGGFFPVNPGGIDVLRDKWGSFFTYDGGKSIAIIPHLEDNE